MLLFVHTDYAAMRCRLQAMTSKPSCLPLQRTLVLKSTEVVTASCWRLNVQFPNPLPQR